MHESSSTVIADRMAGRQGVFVQLFERVAPGGIRIVLMRPHRQGVMRPVELCIFLPEFVPGCAFMYITVCCNVGTGKAEMSLHMKTSAREFHWN